MPVGLHIAATRIIPVCLLFKFIGIIYPDEILPARVGLSKIPAGQISSYHLFRDPKRQIPNDRVIPYDLNTPHFADYATLRRFIWLPEGKTILYQDDDTLRFPIGAVLVLTVGYPNDMRNPSKGESIIETRLLTSTKEGWTGSQYFWDKETTEAWLSVAGGSTNVSWIYHDGQRREHVFHMPNKNQCKQCHETAGALAPLGPVKAGHINKDFPYTTGKENQLIHWKRIGYLRGGPENPDKAPRTPAWDVPDSGSLEDRARAYLDMNCGSCHRPNGAAYTSGLDLTYEQRTPFRYGVYKAPVAAGRGVGNTRFAILPGDPGVSMLVHRLSSVDPGIRMPVVGRGLVHEEGVSLIREWIAELSFTELAERQKALDQKRSWKWDPPKVPNPGN